MSLEKYNIIVAFGVKECGINNSEDEVAKYVKGCEAFFFFFYLVSSLLN